ncbi:MAG TPA: hypothetical protein VGF81_14145 [Solirubrobacteraceae bacterium]
MTPQDELYGLPLERFTDERNALAKRLRQAGRRDEGVEVSKLRKPSVAAWAVNQLVRTQKRELGALFKAGDALQKAQQDVLAGRADAGELRSAADAERRALEALIAKGRGLLSAEGHELAPAKLEQVSETLHAAAIEEQARAEVREGCLVRELRHVGLGALGAGGAATTRHAAAPRKRPASRKPADDERAKRLKSARQAEAAARRELERAERALEVADEHRARAAQALADTEQAVAAARERAEAARGEHERAQRALDEL